MRRLALGLLLLLGGTGAVSAELKIAYVNTARVIDEAPQAEAAKLRLEQEFGPRDKKLVDAQTRIKQIEEELEKGALVLKDTDKRAKEHELTSLKRDLRRTTQEFREDYNLRRNEELASLQKLVQRTINELAKQDGYDLVLHEGVMFASPKTDITDKVLKKLGKK
jgi:outer membrane protein